MSFAFEKLKVYQKSLDFADQACTLTREFPRGYYFLADQLNRAGLSIAANIAEGNGRFTRADRRNFFGIARGSAQTCVPMLKLTLCQKSVATHQHRQQRSEQARCLSIPTTTEGLPRSRCRWSPTMCEQSGLIRGNTPTTA